MADLLQAIRTVSIRQDDGPALTEHVVVRSRASPKPISLLDDTTTHKQVDDVLSILQNQPSEVEVSRQLRLLLDNSPAEFDIHTPSTRTTSILRAVFRHTLPDFWFTSRNSQSLLCETLTSLPGIRGLLAELSSAGNDQGSGRSGSSAKADQSLSVYLCALQEVVSKPDVAYRIWIQISSTANEAQRKLAWKDFSAMLSSGKVVSVVAKYQDQHRSDQQTWLSNGQEYTIHLAHWISEMVNLLNESDETGWSAAAGLLSNGLRIGYDGVLVFNVCQKALEGRQAGLQAVSHLLSCLRPLEQRRILGLILCDAQKIVPATGNVAADIRKLSAYLASLLARNNILHAELLAWAQKPVSVQTATQACRRAVLAVLGMSTDNIATVLETSMQTFAENLFIKHAPSLEQEACAEVILLSAGLLKRQDSKRLAALARSSVHMNGVSSRLNSSTQRARTLGMCVAMGVSSLVDTGSAKMDFDVEDVKTAYARNLMALVEVNDEVGSAEDLFSSSQSTARVPQKKVRIVEDIPTISALANKTPSVAVKHNGPRIVEVLSDDEDDLVTYDKPDSDPEDEEDDPTLINRDKIKAPVYIRDLMSGLREDEKYDRLRLSLEHAAPLIRRKAQFGKELSDHAVELGTILIGLQDTFELEGFVELRLQALIALLASDPAELGPWFARQVFEGDYSLSQRGTMLSAIGLCGRELAGLKDTDALNPSVTAANPFPSKALPAKYHAMYSPTPSDASTPLSAISASLTDSIIAPLAATAADTATGPSALKVRTFSSRLKAPTRTRIIPNALASLLSDSLFTPLAGHFYTFSRGSDVFTSPFFLSTYLTTLAVLLHASGPATRALPQLSQDFWALLLSARRGADDHAVLRALLFGFLTLLDVNAEDTRRVATELGRELVETHAWMNEVYGRLPGGDEESDKLRGLAAGVLVKCGEVMEKWERLLVGDMMDYH